MIRKSRIGDLYRRSQTDLNVLYQKLCETFDDNNPFASFGIGAGYYEWSDGRCDWKQMTEASECKQSDIRDALENLKHYVATRVRQEELVKLLFTVPDDSYIYYNDDDNGEIRILLTGWGFSIPQRLSPRTRDVVEMTGRNPIHVSFVNDGEKVPNYQFGIKTPKQIKPLYTNAEGVYEFPDMKVGEHFVLYDTDETQAFSLDIVSGQKEYSFDITKHTVPSPIPSEPREEEIPREPKNKKLCPHILVESEDEVRIAGYPIVVEINGEVSNYVSDNNGIVALPEMEEGDPFIIRDGNDVAHSAEYTLTEDSEEYIFVVPTPEEPTKDIKLMFRAMNGDPIRCENVSFKQNGQTDLVTKLDENGDTYISEGRFEVGTPISFLIYGWNNKEQYPPLLFTLDKDEYEYLLQERKPRNSWWAMILNFFAILVAILGLVKLGWLGWRITESPDLVFFYVMSVLTFALFAWDKHLAYAQRTRIPESVLLLAAFFGGAFGALCAMIFFRHKTLHKMFTIWVPIFVFIQLAIDILLRVLYF